MDLSTAKLTVYYGSVFFFFLFYLRSLQYYIDDGHRPEFFLAFALVVVFL